ncbi:putative E3 ubiquitin-protein ligase LNX isoform X3 [Apostichopus japonicus]|uniref:Putative E3 ubiquitin-protein ligase LNX isoform X3 n=1 Tax=Stichopus japonicus TaxID=307972 RepID=A0A2G8JQH5_STIJA|nr:putative E3 ubiquitin-protein ligase LNX isoform X3 [Apostichopus japonicus]
MASAMQYVESACAKCGREHSHTENHEYEYKDTVDDDMNCHICLAPILDPLDTKCGHTFCDLCITQTVKAIKMCPLDRKPTRIEELRESNYAFKRLLDKLKVECPNCSAGMERGQLEGHLQGRCRSKRVRCTYAGCQWNGPEREHADHVETCEFGFKNASIKNGAKTTIEFEMEEGELIGISVVGGNETPLIAIMVQEVFQNGAAKRDKRLKAGDIILKVNDMDIQDVQHVVAKNALSSAKGTIKLMVYREQREMDKFSSNLELKRVSIMKNKGVPLGISISGKKKQPGVFIVNVTPDSVAARDRRLKAHDRIVEVNGRRVNQIPPARVSELFKQNNRQINLLIAREKSEQSRRNSKDFESSVAAEATYQPLRLAVIPRARAEKTVVIKKCSSSEKLGMSLAGGISPKVNIPIYVSKIGPDGCVGRSGQLNVGDIILAVDGKKLSDLSHQECLDKVQKANKNSRQVSFKVIEADDIENGGNGNSYHPSWLKWLALPPQIDNSKKVSLQKAKEESLGFIITGGIDSSHGPQPIFIQTVMPGGVAYKSKLLKCGDIIVKVNDNPLTRVSHEQALQVLRGVKEKADLVIKSWPGTLV